MKEEFVHLKQQHWLLECPLLSWLFKRTYCPQGIVQFNEGKLAVLGDTVKWLDKFHIEALSEKAADKIAFDFLKKQYPMYGDYVQLF